jgi:hypothetical protein
MFLKEDVQLVSITIYSTPQNERFSINRDTHFIQMPFIARFPFPFLDYIAKMVGELNAPFTDGFVAYIYTSESKFILNIFIAMVEAVIRPYSLAYNG